MERIYRTIEDKWSVQWHKDTPIHKAGLLLPPGNWEAFDPFLLMAEDNMKKGAFDYHPHRGMETVSYMIDGQMNHQDNRGNTGRLSKGDVQWMTAGKGLLHNEEAPENGFAHLLQLWVNLPADSKMVEPRYQDISYSDMPVRKEPGVEIRVISGSSGPIRSRTLNYVPVTMVEAILQSGRAVNQDLPPGYNGFIFVLEGSGLFGANAISGTEQDVLWLSKTDEPSDISIKAESDLKVLIVAGQPLHEPVVAKGPFVMNTEGQINQAYADYRAGFFGKWNEE